MSTRYALYFAPEAGSPLAEFGEAVLGRTATQARSADATGAYSDRQRWLALTTSPAHYGFHATLKAPFELAEGCSLDELKQQVAAFASTQSPIALPGLRPRRLSNFAALTLEHQPEALSSLAFRVVEAFEPWRRPLSDQDIERRKQQALSDRQLELLERYGYPYVGEEFRFHMTLSGPLGEQDQDFVNWLQEFYARQLEGTPQLDQLAIYAQTSRSMPFIRLNSYPLGSARDCE